MLTGLDGVCGMYLHCLFLTEHFCKLIVQNSLIEEAVKLVPVEYFILYEGVVSLFSSKAFFELP